jgi:hypothetical protein
MKVIIEKELCHPQNGELVGPHYHITKVDEHTGEREFVKTIDGDIKEAARFAERELDLNVLEVAYRENPDSFKSSVSYGATNSVKSEPVKGDPFTKDKVRKFVGMFKELFEADFAGEESKTVENQVILICQEVVNRMKKDEENNKVRIMTNEDKAGLISREHAKYAEDCRMNLHLEGKTKVDVARDTAYASAIEMAEWKDEMFAEEKKQWVEKACGWLKENTEEYLYDDMVNAFKKAMEEEL